MTRPFQTAASARRLLDILERQNPAITRARHVRYSNRIRRFRFSAARRVSAMLGRGRFPRVRMVGDARTALSSLTSIAHDLDQNLPLAIDQPHLVRSDTWLSRMRRTEKSAQLTPRTTPRTTTPSFARSTRGPTREPMNMRLDRRDCRDGHRRAGDVVGMMTQLEDREHRNQLRSCWSSTGVSGAQCLIATMPH